MQTENNVFTMDNSNVTFVKMYKMNGVEINYEKHHRYRRMVQISCGSDN